MGRDRTRVLVGAVASIALIIAGALVMDWYQVTFDAAVGFPMRLAVDLRHVHACELARLCLDAPLGRQPGMFPKLAAVTMWSSVTVIGLVGFQAGARLLTGSASDALTKLGYMISLMAISIAVAAAYLFGIEDRGPLVGAAAQVGAVLHRTWAPATLLLGLIGALATLYLAVVPESSDAAAAYRPVTLPDTHAMADGRSRTPSMRIPFPEHTGLIPVLPQDPPSDAPHLAARGRPPSAPEPPDQVGSGTGMHLVSERPTTDLKRRAPTAAPPKSSTGPHPIALGSNANRPAPEPRERTATGLVPARVRTTTGLQPARASTAMPAIRTTGTTQPIATPAGSQPIRTALHTVRSSSTGLHPVRSSSTGLHPVRSSSTGLHPVVERPGPAAPGVARTKSGPLLPIPEHLRNRLAYVALTAELTGGGIDARREDGSARLVLWRDVVGVVARRMPDAFDGTTFIDVVSTAGSTLRIVPWTRLTGEPLAAEGDARPRSVVERVVARCPAARVDPATRHFLETGEAAQLPDLETLRAHDERLA